MGLLELMKKEYGENGGSNGPPVSDAELTAWERKRLRLMIKADDRARWLWSSVRTFALWVTAVSVGVVAVKNFIFDFMLGKH